jgi:hypothetical protein
MIRGKAILNLLLIPATLVVHSSFAQQLDSIRRGVEHATVVDTRANEPIRMFGLRLPFRISPIAAKNELSLDAHSGNTWNPAAVLEYRDPSEPYYVKPWDATYHPPYDQMPHRYQLYSADGVIRSLSIAYTRKISSHHEVYAALNAYTLVGGASFIDKPVNDRTIEDFHRVIFGQHDPFRRLENPLNLAEVKFTDRNSHTFQMKPRQLTMGTFDLGYRYFFSILRTERNFWSANSEVQLALPLNRAREHLAAGMLVGTAFTHQFTKRYGFTLALAYHAQNDKLIRVRPQHFDPDYMRNLTGYRFVLAQNFDFKNHQRFTFGIEMQGMTTPINTNIRVDASYMTPEDIGIQTNYYPEHWTPENPIAITNQRRAARGLIRGSEYVTFNFSYRFGGSSLAPTVSLYLQEDWTVIYNTDGRTLPLFVQSNNAQDFGVGVKVVKGF